MPPTKTCTILISVPDQAEEERLKILQHFDIDLNDPFTATIQPDKAGTFFTSFDARSLYANLFEYFFNKQTIGKKMSKEQVGMELLIKREKVLRSKLGEQLMVVGNLKKLHDQFNSFAEPNCAAQTNVLSAIDELQKDHHNCLQELENVRNQMIEEKRKRKVAIMQLQNLCKAAKRELTLSTRINARKFGIVAKVQISTEEKLFSIISLNGEDDLSNGEKFKVLMCIIRALDCTLFHKSHGTPW